MTKQELDKLIISPEVWPGKELQIQPGDLSKFTPYGNGVYGYQRNSLEPIKGDPPQEATAGLVYFGNSIKKEDFESFLRMMNVRGEVKDYAAFVQESTNPIKDRYFKQMRFMSKFGLRFIFNAIDEKEYETFKKQELTLGESLWEFMKTEEARFGTSFGDPRIEGKMGGDGDYAREELSFGFMLENEYHNICRIWSRAWLVTK
ncbi:MAG: hypothetical protein ABH840_00005 [Nanoarchaeota archaeon]